MVLVVLRTSRVERYSCGFGLSGCGIAFEFA